MSFIFLSVYNASAQCPFLEFTSQEEVDNYIINYPDCANGQGRLELSGTDIKNLNGLEGIKSFAYLYLYDLPNLESLSGLDSLRTVGLFQIDPLSDLQDINALTGLDSIGGLFFSFNEHITDLSTFQNLEAINTLWTFGNGSLNGLSSPMTNNDLKIVGDFTSNILINSNSTPNSLENIIDPSMDYIGAINIIASSNISFNGLSTLDSINRFSISNSEKLSFNGLENIQNINTLNFRNNDFSEIGIEHTLEQVDKIGTLDIENNSNLISLESYFPSLDSISRSMEIIRNDDLVNLFPIQWREPPQDTLSLFDNQDYRILIEDNAILNDCDTYLLCRARDLYPDSTQVSQNGMNCNESWFENLDCSTILSQEEIQPTHLNIYPNPTTDIVYIESENEKISEIEIYDVSGKLIFKKSNTSSINLEALQNGIYTFLIKTEKGNYHKRVIKI